MLSAMKMLRGLDRTGCWQSEANRLIRLNPSRRPSHLNGLDRSLPDQRAGRPSFHSREGKVDLETPRWVLCGDIPAQLSVRLGAPFDIDAWPADITH